MLIHKLKRKSDGRTTHNTTNIPNGWGYIKDGWYNERDYELLRTEALNNGQLFLDSGERRQLTIYPAREIIVNESDIYNGQLSHIEILKRQVEQDVIDESGSITGTTTEDQYYYITPEVTETQYHLFDNFEIEIEDTESTEFKKANYIQLRKQEYNKRGCSLDDIAVAMWEKLIEGRNENANRIQTEREKIKQELPKP